jgi:hypothetical protein
MEIEGQLLRLAAGDLMAPVGFTVVLATARGGWKAWAARGDIELNCKPIVDQETSYYATGATPAAAVQELLRLALPRGPRLVTDDRRFPVLRSGGGAGLIASVPWLLVQRHEAQAVANHGGQSLEVLAQRGGLDPVELWCVVNDRAWTARPDSWRTREDVGTAYCEAWLRGITDLRSAIIHAEGL